MLQKRLDEEHDDTNGTTLAEYETLRAAGTRRADREPPAEKKDEEKVSLFWRLFGGTLLSIVALVVITLFNNLNGTINDLRADVSREREARAGLAKKDDIDSRIKTQYDRIRTIEGYKGDIEAVRERATATGAVVEGLRKELGGSVDALKKDVAGVELLKERVAAVEAVKKDVAAIDGLKEKLAAVTLDLKAARDEVQKLQQEVERNRASDLERKSFRDVQAKQLDETVKELQRGIQACREKIARLEGASPAGSPAPKSKDEAKVRPE